MPSISKFNDRHQTTHQEAGHSGILYSTAVNKRQGKPKKPEGYSGLSRTMQARREWGEKC